MCDKKDCLITLNFDTGEGWFWKFIFHKLINKHAREYIAHWNFFVVFYVCR